MLRTKRKSLAAMISAVALSSQSFSASTIDMVVVIDESGSMSGEHNAFIGSYVQNIDNILVDQNVTLNQYGLVGFGGSPSVSANEAGREEGSNTYRHFNLTLAPDSIWGSANDFNAVTTQLETSGGYEDGYRAIDYTYRNYMFREAAGASILLITDEDRDNDTYNLNSGNIPAGQSEIDKALIQSELTQHNTVLHAVVAQRFTDQSGNPAIAIVGADPSTGYAYVQDAGTGAIIKVQGYVLMSGSGTTQQDYTELALSSGGIAMDIDALRDVYTDINALNALSAELANLVAQISASQPSVVVGINCNNASGAAAQICSAIQASGNNQLQQVGNQLSSALQYRPLGQYQIGQMLQSLQSGSRNIGRMVFNRLQNTRQAGVAYNDLDLMSYSSGNIDIAALTSYDSSNKPLSGGGASADFSDIGFFIRGRYTSASYDDSANFSGYDTDAYTLVAGADRFLSESTQLGIALSYATTDTGFSQNGGDSQSDSLGVSVYGSYQLKPNLHLQMSTGFASADFDSTRNNGVDRLSSETDGEFVYVSAGIEKDNIEVKGFQLSPFGYLHYTRIEIDGFTESGGVTALSVKDTDTDSVISELGVDAEYAIFDDMRVNLRLAWEHEFADTQTSAVSSFVVSPNNSWTTSTPDNATDFGRIGAGLSKDFGSAGVVSIWADALVGDSDYDEYSLEVKYRYVF